MGCVTTGDIVLVDRNCHKSIEHAITMTHSLPVYLLPTRNRYGIIGPIHPDQMKPEAIAAKIAACPLTLSVKTPGPSLAVVTNSTYDGLCYDATRVEDLLGKSVDRIQYDEAWYAYARFNPLYRNRFAMRKGDQIPGSPTVFATQSTHKLLAAFSQASMIHVRNGRNPIEHECFNEAFMMHTSTSPFYPIIASLDVSSKMMDGSSGTMLTTECIDEAIRFRRMMARIARELGKGKEKPDWWFGMWQPDIIRDPRTGKTVPFADAHHDLLRDEPSCWVLHPGDSWHGFLGLEDGYCMLDPIKVTVLTPGGTPDGSPDAWGIPASVVVKFLETRGIISEKSGDYNIHFLFSMGITKGKWGTLVSELFEFKRHYDENSPLDEIFPDLTTLYPKRYGAMTLRELVAEMHEFMRKNRQGTLLETAFSLLPEPVLTFADAYQHLVKGEVEQVQVTQMGGRIVATGVVPYPPGIPLLMPGERAGGIAEPVLQYLLALQNFDARFPGFSHDIHGVECTGGKYRVFCLREDI
jgi:lysine decarboxylase/arginine decarboxylase